MLGLLRGDVVWEGTNCLHELCGGLLFIPRGKHLRELHFRSVSNLGWSDGMLGVPRGNVVVSSGADKLLELRGGLLFVSSGVAVPVLPSGILSAHDGAGFVYFMRVR